MDAWLELIIKVFVPIVTGLIAIIAFYVKRDKKALDKNTEAVNRLSIALVRVEVLLDQAMKRTDEIPEIRKDLNELGNKVRNGKVEQ